MEHKDNSMKGVTCNLEAFPNTKETFVFHIFTGNEPILSIKSKDTLIGKNADLKVSIDSASNHLILSANDKPEGTVWEN